MHLLLFRCFFLMQTRLYLEGGIFLLANECINTSFYQTVFGGTRRPKGKHLPLCTLLGCRITQYQNIDKVQI